MFKRSSRNNYKDITEYAHFQIDRVRGNYKWLASLLTVIAVFSISAIAFLSYNNINDMKIEMRGEIDRITKNVDSQIKLLTDRLEFDLDKEVNLIEREVRSRVEAEFDKDNIQLVVKSVAEEKINFMADELIEKKIKKDINPVLLNVDEKINKLSESIESIDLISKKNI